MFVLVGFIFLTYKYQISQETRQSLTFRRFFQHLLENFNPGMQ